MNPNNDFDLEDVDWADDDDNYAEGGEVPNDIEEWDWEEVDDE